MGEKDDILARALGPEMPEMSADETGLFPDPLRSPEAYNIMINQFRRAHGQGPEAVTHLYDEKCREGWSRRFLAYASCISLTEVIS